jgi:two-component system response regulator CpxR
MAYILIIDDDEDFAGAAARVLENAGHQVTVQPDIDHAMNTVKERTPDLLVLDVMFPEDSSGGFKFARDIRELDGDAARMPILMLTAINSQFPLGFGTSDIDDTWMPVEDFLEKPIDLDTLERKVDALLAQSRPA